MSRVRKISRTAAVHGPGLSAIVVSRINPARQTDWFVGQLHQTGSVKSTPETRRLNSRDAWMAPDSPRILIDEKQRKIPATRGEPLAKSSSRLSARPSNAKFSNSIVAGRPIGYLEAHQSSQGLTVIG